MDQVPLDYLALPMMPLEQKQFGGVHKDWINDKQQYGLQYMQMGFRELSLYLYSVVKEQE